MTRRLSLAMGSLGTTILAILVGWWLTSPSARPAANEGSALAVIQNCTDYPEGPDRAYCDRDLSAIAMQPPCDTLTNASFQLECWWRETIVKRNPKRCEDFPGDRRDLCLWDVSVVRHAYASRPAQPDFSLCDQIRRADIQQACRTRSYAMKGKG